MSSEHYFCLLAGQRSSAEPKRASKPRMMIDFIWSYKYITNITIYFQKLHSSYKGIGQSIFQLFMSEHSSFISVEEVEEHYEIIQRLGVGSFAEVYKARALNSQNELRAIKKIILTWQEQEGAMEEVQNLKMLKSEHIIDYYHSLKEKQGNDIIVLNVVMHFCQGNLRNLIKKKKFSPEQVLNLIIQITVSMLVLDEKEIMHLDLKPQNILYENQGYFKICDFGCAQLMRTSSSQEIRKIENCAFGTPRYISPEIKLNFNYSTRSSCDMWSLGIIIYEILYEKHPFTTNPKNGQVNADQFEEFINGSRQIEYLPLPEGYPVELLREMLHNECQKRLRWSQLKKKLIKEYGRYKFECQPIKDGYQQLRRTLLAFVCVIYLIKDNLAQNPHNFWVSEGSHLSKLAQLLISTCYLHMLLFKDRVGYKLTYLGDKYKEFQLFWKNLQIQQNMLANENNVQMSALKDFDNKQKQLNEQIVLVLRKLKQSEQKWESMEKLKIFCQQASEIKEYVCCIEKLKNTQEQFKIN